MISPMSNKKKPAAKLNPILFVAIWTASSSFCEAANLMKQFAPTLSSAEILEAARDYRVLGVQLKDFQREGIFLL